MEKIEFKKEEKAIIVQKIQMYFTDELDQKIGQFDAEFLLDFFSEEVGAYYYNQGLSDAGQIIDERVEAIKDSLYEIEMPTTFRK